jgi:hypothetical protein
VKRLECGCETNDGGRILSLCHTHGTHMQAVTEAAKHPRAGRAHDPGLTEKLLVAAMPTATELLARGGAGNDPETIAQRVTDLIHQIQRRLE